MANEKVSFRQVDILPTENLIKGCIYFEKNTGTIHVAISDTEAIPYGESEYKEIGGTNLIKNTDGLNSALGYTVYQGATITYGTETIIEFGNVSCGTLKSSGGSSTLKIFKHLNPTKTLIENNMYTVSAWVKNLSDSESLIVKINGFYTELDNTIWPEIKLEALEAKRVSLTGYRNRSIIQFQLLNSSNADVYAAVWRIKLEEGNKSTAWSPAPEDIVQEANDYTDESIKTWECTNVSYSGDLKTLNNGTWVSTNSSTDRPSTSGFYNILDFNLNGNSKYKTQLALGQSSNSLYYRYTSDPDNTNTWDGSWKQLSFTDHTHRERTLLWGGPNYSGAVGPVDAAMYEEFSANRLAYFNPSYIKIEYSTNGGSTWLDYGASSDVKTALVTTSTSLNIGKISTSTQANTNMKLRITLSSKTGYNTAYFRLRKIAVYLSTNGATGANVSVEYSNQGSETTFKKHTPNQNVGVSGQPGWNIIQFDKDGGYTAPNFGGGGTQTQNWHSVRLTFGITGVSSSSSYKSVLQIFRLRAFGEVAWTTFNNLSASGHIYSYDADQNAIFPNYIYAKKFIVSGGTSSQILMADGSVSTKPTIGNGTVTITQNETPQGTFTLNQTGNTTIELTDTKNTAGAINSINKLYLIGAPNQKSTTVTYSNNNVFIEEKSNKIQAAGFKIPNGTPSQILMADGSVSAKPTIGNGLIIIKQNGVEKGDFGLNQPGDATIELTDTTYSNFKGATSTTAGKSGLVPAPSAGDSDCFLRGDGTWGDTYNLYKNIKITGASTDTNTYQANNWIQLCSAQTISQGQFYINVNLGTFLTSSFRMDIIREGSSMHPLINVWSSNDNSYKLGLEIAVTLSSIYIRATSLSGPVNLMKDIYIEIKQYINEKIFFPQYLTQRSSISGIKYLYSIPDGKNQLFTENLQTNSISISEGDPTQILKANGFPTTGGSNGTFLMWNSSGVRWSYPSVFRDIFTRTLKIRNIGKIYKDVDALMDIDSNGYGDVYVNIHVPSINITEFPHVTPLMSKTYLLSFSNTSSSYTEGEDTMMVYVVSGTVDTNGNTFLQIKGYCEFPDTTFVESLVDVGVDIYLY